jgi:hypothetical protein
MALRVFTIVLVFACAAGINGGSLQSDSAIASPLHQETLSEHAPAASSYKQLYSLFGYHHIVSLGLSFSYLYYNEDIDISDIIGKFSERFGHSPRIVGTPKSTEYGTALGVTGSVMYFNWEKRLMVRPRAGLTVGFDNTYDGSLQGQLYRGSLNDTIGVEFDPYSFKKNNVFLFSGCDAGYAFPSFFIPCFMYTGLDFKLWYRDLMNNQGTGYYNFEVNNWETYYWFSIPLGIYLARQTGAAYVLGADACVNFMFYGAMKAGQTSGEGGVTIDYPAVTLGNRAAVRVEVFIQKKRDDGPSVRFSPYFMFYTFGRSNSDIAQSSDGGHQTFYEPSSKSFLFGLTISWEFPGKTIN